MQSTIHIFPINIFATILVVVIFCILYYFLFKYDYNSTQSKNEANCINFGKLIITFGETYNSLSSTEFLKQISFIFRDFLEKKKGYKNLSKLTLEEALKLDIEKRYYKILEKIYLKEYKETNLDLEEKQKIYLEVRRIMVEKRKV